MKRTSLAFFLMASRSSDEQVSSELALAADDALTSDARQRAEIRRLKESNARLVKDNRRLRGDLMQFVGLWWPEKDCSDRELRAIVTLRAIATKRRARK